MASLNPSFGGYVYADHGALLSGAWKDDQPTRESVAAAARSNVARRRDGFLGPREINLDGILIAQGTRDDFRAAIDAFKYAHREGFRPFMLEDDRQIMAQAQTRTTSEDATRVNAMSFSVRMICPDPYFYALSSDTDTWPFPTTGAIRTILNAGSAPAAPTFTIPIGTATAADMTLTLYLDTPTTAAASFSLTFAAPGTTLGTGDVLAVDCAEMTVKLNGVNAMTALGGSFFQIPAGGGTLRLALTGAPINAVITTLTPRYL